MKKLLLLLLLPILAFGAITSSQQQNVAPPDGEIYAVGIKTVEWVVRECLAGRCGSHIFVRGDATLFSKAFYDGHIFVVSNCDTDCIETLSKITKGGNFVNSKTFSKFVQALKEAGWRSLPLASLKDPITFLMALSQNSIPSAYLLPVGAVNISQEMLAEMYPIENY